MERTLGDRFLSVDGKKYFLTDQFWPHFWKGGCNCTSGVLSPGLGTATFCNTKYIFLISRYHRSSLQGLALSRSIECRKHSVLSITLPQEHLALSPPMCLGGHHSPLGVSEPHCSPVCEGGIPAPQACEGHGRKRERVHLVKVAPLVCRSDTNVWGLVGGPGRRP